MPIEYTLTANPLTTPPSYSPHVATKNTRRIADLTPRLAERTAQSPEAVTAVLSALGDEILQSLLAGDAVILDDITQITPTLTGRVATATGDLPPNSNPGISLRPVGKLLADFKAQAQFTRIAGDNLAPQILEVKAISGSLTALRDRDILELSGNRLGLDAAQTDEGLFFVPTATGSAVRATIYLDTGDKTLRVQVPSGLTAAATYTLRVDARRAVEGLVRSTSWGTPITAA